MTDDELKQAAEAAELCSQQEWYGQNIMAAQWQEDVDLMPYLRRFAAAVQAAERERCAQVAEGAQQLPNSGDDFANGWCSAALQIAQAIRA